MKYEVNECCDCATESYPCIGDSCSLRHVTYYQCDRCGCDGLTEDEIHEVDGEDLCDTCYDEEFQKRYTQIDPAFSPDQFIENLSKLYNKQLRSGWVYFDDEYRKAKRRR